MDPIPLNEEDRPAPRRCRVITDYQRQYPDPIRVRAGAAVTLTGQQDDWHGWIWIWGVNDAGKAGWLPQDAVEQRGDQTVARYDYDASELTVSAGDDVTVEQATHGWLWCVNAQGQGGWVPAEHVECP